MWRISFVLLTNLAALALSTTAGAVPAALDASSNHLKFGAQPANTLSTLTVTVTNRSSDTVFINGAIIVTDLAFDWDLSQLTLNTCAQVVSTLPPGASCTAPILFAPTQPGHFRGSLIFEYQIGGVEAPGSPLTIDLSGRATSP